MCHVPCVSATPPYQFIITPTSQNLRSGRDSYGISMNLIVTAFVAWMLCRESGEVYHHLFGVGLPDEGVSRLAAAAVAVADTVACFCSNEELISISTVGE